MFQLKIPLKKNKIEVKKFFKKKGLNFIVNASEGSERKVNQMKDKKLLKPDLNDLYRLYQFVILNKRTTILELGSGWSSLVFNLALSELKKKYSNDIKKLRRNNPFELFILENSKKFLNISKKRIIKFNSGTNLKQTAKNHYIFSNVEMTLYKDIIATKYLNFPLCNPDFIYIDGPDQFNVKKSINGVSTRHNDMMPMISDVLKIEYFFTPGTIIVLDGRAANAIFLKDHFKRNWNYINDKKNDQHIFLLKDQLLGEYNKKQIEFYKN